MKNFRYLWFAAAGLCLWYDFVPMWSSFNYLPGIFSVILGASSIWIHRLLCISIAVAIFATSSALDQSRKIVRAKLLISISCGLLSLAINAPRLFPGVPYYPILDLIVYEMARMIFLGCLLRIYWIGKRRKRFDM